MIWLNFCDFCDAYTLVKRTITVQNTAAEAEAVNDNNEKVISKNRALFNNYLTEINNPQADDTQDVDIIMPVYKLKEYSDAYSKTSRCLWQYYRDKPALYNNNTINDFPANFNNSTSFKFKQQITGQTGDGGTKFVETMFPLKYLRNLSRTIEIPLINCEINLQLK